MFWLSRNLVGYPRKHHYFCFSQLSRYYKQTYNINRRSTLIMCSKLSGIKTLSTGDLRDAQPQIDHPCKPNVSKRTTQRTHNRQFKQMNWFHYLLLPEHWPVHTGFVWVSWAKPIAAQQYCSPTLRATINWWGVSVFFNPIQAVPCCPAYAVVDPTRGLYPTKGRYLQHIVT